MGKNVDEEMLADYFNRFDKIRFILEKDQQATIIMISFTLEKMEVTYCLKCQKRRIDKPEKRKKTCMLLLALKLEQLVRERVLKKL